jgi:hypothetical protein
MLEFEREREREGVEREPGERIIKFEREPGERIIKFIF